MFRYLHKVPSTVLGPEKSAESLTKESYPTEAAALPTSVVDRNISSTVPSSESLSLPGHTHVSWKLHTREGKALVERFYLQVWQATTLLVVQDITNKHEEPPLSVPVVSCPFWAWGAVSSKFEKGLWKQQHYRFLGNSQFWYKKCPSR